MTKALILCAHRTMTLPTFGSIMNLMSTTADWRVLVEAGDALISRVRSIAVSRWLREFPGDEAFLMVDDDFQFTPEAAEAIVNLAIEKRSIAAGVTPLRSGHYTAIVPLNGEREMWLAPDVEPFEIKWAGGALAYHRDVFVRMAKTLPLLHKNDTISSFWPFFMPSIHTMADGREIYLSEDYACHERARELGFKVWVQPAAQIGHLSEVMTTPQNMPLVHQAIYGRSNGTASANTQSTLLTA